MSLIWSALDTFEELWDDTSTYINGYNSSGNYYTGETYTSQIGLGLKECIEYLNGTCTYVSSNNPTYNTYKFAVLADKSATLSFWVLYSGSQTGHTVSVNGYKTVSCDNITSNFLRVADGWNASIRYLNFTSTDFINVYSYVFTIE